MSRVTNPDTEFSVSCGFFNSIGDRKYDSTAFCDLVDGLITNGVFASVGTCFVVKASTGNTINVGVGKAWFNRTWTLNDAILPLTCTESDMLLNRIDAIVIEVNNTVDVRDNFIKVIEGDPATNPVRPTLTNDSSVHQHALCYIYRPANSKEINDADITNVVGTDETPFVTGLLQTVSLDVLLGQWRAELDRFVATEEADFDAFRTAQETEYETWYAKMKQLMSDVTNELNEWTENHEVTILDWFQQMRDQLSEDSAINLQRQINKSEIERMLLVGFTDGRKTFSEDGTVITSVNSSGYTLTKTFENNFQIATTILTDPHSTELGRLVKYFSADGRVIDSEITIL